jgi:hypothetical protein
MFGGSSMQWDPVRRLYRALVGLFPVMAADGPRQPSMRCQGIVYVSSAPAIQTVVVPVGVTILLGLYNPPRSWTGTVGPFLPSFTVAPCVDSLLCYRIQRAA